MSESAKVRVGIVGAGGVARRVHAPGLRLIAGVEIVAAADPSPEAAASLGAATVYGDHRAMLAEARPDAVVIASPNYLHHSTALDALEAGAHVLCEKPLALNASEAEEMLDAAERSGRAHMTAFTYHFMPAAARLRQLVKEGELGEIRTVRGAYLMAASPHLRGWRSEKPKAGSGALGDLGSHLIHLALRCAGSITRLTALERRFSDSASSDVDDWVGFLAEFSGGACGTFEISRVCPGRGDDIGETMSLEIYGSRGGAVLSMDDPLALRLALGAAGADPERPLERVEVPSELVRPAGSPRDPKAEDPRWGYRYDQAWRFIEAVRGRAAPDPSFEDGLRCQQVLDAVQASSASGRWEMIHKSA